MAFIKVALLTHFLFISNSFAQNFCELAELNKKSANKEQVKDYIEEIKEIGNPLFASNKDDCNFIKSKQKDNSFIVLDARGRGMRGSIPGAFKVISDHDDLKNHEFTSDNFNKKMEKLLTKYKKMEIDPKKYNYIIFCNGPTCFRTAWAACSLQKLGYKKEQLNLVLDGFFGLKKSCL